MAYCNITTDLKDVYADIGNYVNNRILEGWQLAANQSNTYFVTHVGFVEFVLDDGKALTSQTSIANCESNAGSFYFDTTNDVLYVHAHGGDDLTQQDAPRIEDGVRFTTIANRAVKEASEEIDSYLNPLFETPLLPRLTQTHVAELYETPIRKACALLACRNIIQRNNPNDAVALERKALGFNPEPGEEMGWIAKIKAGEVVLQEQITAREVAHWNVYPDSGNATTGYVRLWGRYGGSQYERWKLQIDTAGTPGTATWKLAWDGTNFDKTLQETFNATNNDRRIHLSRGVYCVFIGTFVEDDFWTIEVFPTSDEAQAGKVSSSQVTR